MKVVKVDCHGFIEVIKVVQEDVWSEDVVGEVIVIN